MTQDELYVLEMDIIRYLEGNSDLYWKLSAEQVDHVKIILGDFFKERTEIMKKVTRIKNRERLRVPLDE